MLGTLDFADGKETFQKVVYYEKRRQGCRWPDSADSCTVAHVTDSSYLSFVSTNNGSECEARRTAHSI